MNIGLPTDLPNGWVVVRLEEICTHITDGTHKTPDYQPEGVRFISIKNIRPFAPVDWDSYIRFITENEHRELTKRCKPEYDDILFPRIGTLGFAKRVDFEEEVSLFVGLGLLKPDRAVVLPKYLECYMNTPWISRLSHEWANGSGRLTLPLEESRRLPVVLAPIKEQARIADALDELFSDLDAGVEALTSIREKLTLYRASVLKAAVEGMLTASKKPYPLRPLGEAIASIGQGWSPKCENSPSTEVAKWAVIKTTAIQPLLYMQEHNKQLPDSLDPRPHLELAAGDLLVTRAGPRSRVGVACLVRHTRPRLMLCDKAYRIRCKTDRIISSFLEVVLNAPHIVDELDKLKTGISDSGVNLTQDRLADLLVPCPSIAEQQAIVEAVEDQISVIDHIEADIEAKLKNAQALRQAILRHAFTGQLVPQEPNDEPASELLKRIVAEREQRTHDAAAAKRTNNMSKVRTNGRGPRRPVGGRRKIKQQKGN